VAGTADRQKFRKSLDNTEDNPLIKFHLFCIPLYSLCIGFQPLNSLRI
jgi:hypothetical protein